MKRITLTILTKALVFPGVVAPSSIILTSLPVPAFLLALLATILIPAITMTVHAREHHVGEDHFFKTISAAAGVAQPGDTIIPIVEVLGNSPVVPSKHEEDGNKPTAPNRQELPQQ